MNYILKQKYFALRPFESEGTLEEIAEIITAGKAEIIHLDAEHYGPDARWEEPAEGYERPGWYYKTHDDSRYYQAASLEDAIRKVGSHDTSDFSLEPSA